MADQDWFADQEADWFSAQDRGTPAGSRMEPMASHGGPRQPTFPERALSTIGDINIGALKGLGRTGLSTLRLIASGSPVAAAQQMALGGQPETPEMLRPSNGAQSYGGVMADVGTSLAPISRAAKSVEAAPFLIRGLTNMATGGAVSAAQGHSPVMGAVGGAIPEVGRLATSSSVGVGRRLLGGVEPSVAESALANRAMPGLFRTGESRAGARMGAADTEARRILAGPAGHPDVTPRQTPEIDRVFADISDQQSPLRELEYGRANPVAEGYMNSGPVQARTAYSEAQGTGRRVMGQSGPVADMTRATAQSGRNLAASGAPEAKSAIQRVNDLYPVTEAYQRGGGKVLPPDSVKTLTGKLAAQVINRLPGPATQGAYNVGRMSQSDAIRAAMIQLLAQEEQQRAQSDGAR